MVSPTSPACTPTSHSNPSTNPRRSTRKRKSDEGSGPETTICPPQHPCQRKSTIDVVDEKDQERLLNEHGFAVHAANPITNRIAVHDGENTLASQTPEEESHKGLPVVALRVAELLRHPAKYCLRVQCSSRSTPEALVLHFDPWSQAICDVTGGSVIPPSLVLDFKTQLRCHFNRPASDEPILSVHTNVEDVNMARILPEDVVGEILSALRPNCPKKHANWLDKLCVSFRDGSPHSAPLQPV